MRKNDGEFLAVREAARRLGKAPPTVRLMLERGQLDGVFVVTEAGHRRQYVAAASVTAYLEQQDAAEAA